jgi:hypothetical protein
MSGRYSPTSCAAEVATFLAAEEVKTDELPLRCNVGRTKPVDPVAERPIESVLSTVVDLSATNVQLIERSRFDRHQWLVSPYRRKAISTVLFEQP